MKNDTVSRLLDLTSQFLNGLVCNLNIPLILRTHLKNRPLSTKIERYFVFPITA